MAAAVAAATPRHHHHLAGQRVLVTGGGRGIGRALAVLCHREGARVAIASRTKAELDETAMLARDNNVCDNPADAVSLQQQAPTPVLPLVADVTKEDHVEQMVQTLVDQWGGLDLLVNNAGGAQSAKGPFETLASDDLRRLLELNVVSVHVVTSAVLSRAMPKDGRIINISSRAGKVGLPNYSFYVASKFALEGMTASLAEELKDRNITVNTLSPGMVDTRSFPKAPGRKGVRTAESVSDGFFALLESGKTGHYLHVDELDQARASGLPDAAAIKPIREPLFSP